MADKTQTQTQSTLGAVLRGIANGISLGLDDEALTGAAKLLGTHDYGQDLRDNEELDRQQHPYVSTAAELAGSVAPSFIPGVGEGNLARVLMNPAVQGAISAVGNSNDLANGNVSGAVGQAALGAAEGSILSKAINAVGNKMVTGSFGGIPEEVEGLRNWDIPTPNQFTNGGIINTAIVRATKSTPEGIVANQNLLSEVNRKFPNLAFSAAGNDIEKNVVNRLNDETGGNFNANDLRQAINDALSSQSADMRNGVGGLSGVTDAYNASNDLKNGVLNNITNRIAPIHQAIEQAAIPDVTTNSVMKHIPAAIASGLGIASGHLIGGPVLGIATELTPKVGSSISNRIGVNAVNDAIANPAGNVASDVTQNIANVISNPATKQAATQLAVHETSDDSDPDAAYRQKLKSFGWSDKDIDSVIKR